MSRQRSAGTVPELEVRRALHRRGFRYRVDVRADPSLRTRPDITFRREKVAVYIDGCFWHGCPEHATAPAHNADWWSAKLAANVRRDRRNEDELQNLGWTVVRAWEHEDPAVVADRVVATLTAIRASSDQL